MYNSYGGSPQGGAYRAGLGTPGAAQNMAPANGFGQERFSLFVGNIAEGLDDQWLERIFNSCGILLELKRIRDPSGKPKPFGFAEYGDAESVLRCLELLNNIVLSAPALGIENQLKVTADEKTRARLNSYESSRAKTDAQAEAMEYAQNQLRQALDELKEADPSQSVEALAAAEKARKLALIPQHLQDLGPNDLPEESRGVITKEIAFFREQAAKREAAKKAQQAEKDRSAGLAAAHFGSSNTQMSDDRRNTQPAYNYTSQQQQQRPPPQQQQDYQNGNQNFRRSGGGGAFGPEANNFSRQGNNYNNNARGGFHNNNRGGGNQQRQWGSPSSGNGRQPHADDPQEYNRPVGFVRSGQYDDRSSNRGYDSRDAYNPGGRAGEMQEDDMTDEEKERLRQDRIRRETDFIFRDRERKYETKERSRQAATEKDRAREIGVQKNEDADRVKMAQKLAEWDDVKEAEKSRELFHVDRTRWRAQRKAFRQREINEDKKDAELETQQLEKLQKQSESFLNQQADAFAKMSSGAALGKKRIGTPAEDAGGPIKLSLAERAKKEAEVKPVETAPRPRPAAFGAADEQEEVGKKKRELVRLTYSDDEGSGDDDPNERGLTQEEKVERRKRKIKELVETIPTTKEGLWSFEVRWDRLTEKTLQDKILPFTTKKVIEALGTEDEDLVTAVMDKLKEHASAQDMVEELEPILEDEAVEFVIKIWRFVLFEIAAHMNRIKTTTA